MSDHSAFYDDIADPSYILVRNGQNLHEDSDEEPEIPDHEYKYKKILMLNLEINTSITVQRYKTPPDVPVPNTTSVITSKAHVLLRQTLSGKLKT
ncbi:unnamed protein product [Euphydryas editha]|uniref:Uncharacterized protein n=1 Tax=Euphydryas editha TaxID=104508 RepID=A0AAU9UQY1_EUPED|nr:unnamed protein product [Euphydryas editha]